MTITFELPDNLRQTLAGEFNDLNSVAKESALIELYRQDKISRRELSEGLGISRMETDDVLKRHNVTEDLPTEEELSADMEQIRKLLKK